MNAIFASLVLAVLASPALAKPSKPSPSKKPVKEKHHRVAIERLAAVGGLEDLDTLDLVRIDDASGETATQKPGATGNETPTSTGLDYGLKQRRAALPNVHVEDFEAKPLTENQVGAVVRERADDLEYCWLRLPPKRRVVSAAILHLSIEASGKVASASVDGDMPAGVGRCITQMAKRWSFPAADAPSEIDHGIMLTTASQK